MGQEALNSFGLYILYCEFINMNKVYFGESLSLPWVFTMITQLAFFSGYPYEMNKNTVKLCECSNIIGH